jgi:hypothetical protein
MVATMWRSTPFNPTGFKSFGYFGIAARTPLEKAFINPSVTDFDLH